MPKKNNPGCQCCGCIGTFTVNVKGCSSLNLPGASVTIKLSGTTVASGTTNGSGNFVAMLAPGSYTVDVTACGFNAGSGSGTMNGSCTAVNVNIVPGVATGYHCCGNTFAYPLPDTLYLTDSYGTWTLTYDGVSGAWRNCHTITRSGVLDPASSGFHNPLCPQFITSTTPITYSIGCSNLGLSLAPILSQGNFFDSCVTNSSQLFVAYLNANCASSGVAGIYTPYESQAIITVCPMTASGTWSLFNIAVPGAWTLTA